MWIVFIILIFAYLITGIAKNLVNIWKLTKKELWERQVNYNGKDRIDN